MIFSVTNSVFAIDTTTDSADTQIYSVPVISNEYDDTYVTFYDIEGKYYLSFDDIKEFTRFELKETDTTINLTQGLRELVIEKKSGHLIDCDLVDQGNINIKQYNGEYLCEGIPMLIYLGAACALKDNQTLEVMMPTITIWEAIMPDYLDYYFNIEELYNGEDNIKISLAFDIISDIFDGVSGNGLFANSDTHLEDALYEILNVDMMKYESVQEEMVNQNKSINEFLSSDGVSTFFDGSLSGMDLVEELVTYYADFYLDNEIFMNNERWKRSYIAGDLDTASDLSKKINHQIYEQSIIKANLNDANNSGIFDIGMIALDTAITSYNSMQYDDDIRNLFKRTINEEIFTYAEYDNISWNNISDKISRNLSENESIVQSAAFNSIVDYISGEITEKGVQNVLSKFTSKASIYATAIQIGKFISSLMNYDINQAFSADMNAIWLNTVQYDIAQLASRMLIKERDENHFSDEESLLKLKDIFTLYYRTIIAFSENIAQSIEEFGGKNKNEVIQYFSGESGKSVCNYAAMYLYRITNCKLVPIVNYSELTDTLIKIDWIKQYEKRRNVNSAMVCAGESTTSIIDENGNLLICGDNEHGQLGNEVPSNKETYSLVGSNVKFVCGSSSFAVISTDNKLFTWGYNGYGQLGKERDTDVNCDMVQVADGVVDVSITESVCAYVTQNSELYAMGVPRGSFGDDGNTRSSDEPIKIMDNVKDVELSSNNDYGTTFAVITNNNELYMWGNNSDGIINSSTTKEVTKPTKIMDNITRVSLGSDFVLVLTANNELYTWGNNTRGQLGIGNTDDISTKVKIMDNVVFIDTGALASLAITETGDLYTWGYNSHGCLGMDINSESNDSIVSIPTKVMSRVQSASIDGATLIILDQEGDVYTCGWNVEGQLGTGDFDDRNIPINVYNIYDSELPKSLQSDNFEIIDEEYFDNMNDVLISIEGSEQNIVVNMTIDHLSDFIKYDGGDIELQLSDGNIALMFKYEVDNNVASSTDSVYVVSAK